MIAALWILGAVVIFHPALVGLLRGAGPLLPVGLLFLIVCVAGRK